MVLKSSLKIVITTFLACCVLPLVCSLSDAQRSLHTPAIKERVAIKDSIFYSSSLQRNMHYRVIIPRGYATGGRVPVLYLLHGLYGDYQNWDTRTGLENYVQNLRWLIVMPDADDSWYTNSAVPADKFEDYIVKDLIAEIDGKYRTIHDGHARAIAGLSMGGYGALNCGLKSRNFFALAASLSGVFSAAQDLIHPRPEFPANFLEVLGKG